MEALQKGPKSPRGLCPPTQSLPCDEFACPFNTQNPSCLQLEVSIIRSSRSEEEKLLRHRDPGPFREHSALGSSQLPR